MKLSLLKALFQFRKKVPQLNPKGLKQPDQLANQYLIIDVRSKPEWLLSHIDGSINIPITSFSLDHPAIANSRLPILCICLSAHRSTPVARELISAGYQASELKGGMLNWWRLRLPTA